MSQNSGAYFNSDSIGSGESLARETRIKEEQLGEGATVSGVIKRKSSSFDVDIEWLDESGTVVYTESQSSGNSAGDEVTFDINARSHRCNIKVSDESSTGSAGSGEVSGSVRIS